MRRRLGLQLVRDVAAAHDLEPAAAREIVVAVLDAVREDLLQAADVLEEGDGSLGVAARTLALRVAYAGDRAAGKLSGPRRDRSRQPH